MYPQSVSSTDELSVRLAPSNDWSLINTDFGLIPRPILFCGIDTIDAVGYNTLPSFLKHVELIEDHITCWGILFNSWVTAPEPVIRDVSWVTPWCLEVDTSVCTPFGDTPLNMDNSNDDE